jgi:hypothetical protein
MAKDSNLLLTTLKKMKRNNKKIQVQRTTTLNGMMTFGTINDNQHLLDFTSTEFAEMDPFIADCKVQAMRDGNVYITERPRRKKGTPLFREDNSTLTLGRDNRYYFVFTMPKDQLDILPDRLVHQALAIAQKVDAMVAGRVGKKGSKK